MRLALMVAALLLAGCQVAQEQWLLSGTFTAERTSADMDAVCRAAVGSAPCGFLESFPEQYRFEYASERECRDAYERVSAVPNALPSQCARVGGSREGGAPNIDTIGPTPDGAERDFRVSEFLVTWRDPAEEREHEMRWDVVRAWLGDGRVRVETTTYGIEGGDFRFTLWYEPREAPAAVYVHEPGGASDGTFDFTYREAVFFAGEPIDALLSVDRASYVRIEEQDAARGALRGTFRLVFTGTCAEPDCGDHGDLEHPRVLEGRFSS